MRHYLVAVALVLFSAVAFAQNSAKVKSENAVLRAQVKQLETQRAELQERIKELENQRNVWKSVVQETSKQEPFHPVTMGARTIDNEDELIAEFNKLAHRFNALQSEPATPSYLIAPQFEFPRTAPTKTVAPPSIYCSTTYGLMGAQTVCN